MTSVAWPFETEAVAIAMGPSRNVTVPDGIPLAEVTDAVKVTDAPKTDGFGVPETVVSVLAAATDAVTEPLVLDPNATPPS